MPQSYPPQFSTRSQDKALAIADADDKGITKLPWGTKLIDTSTRYFWDGIDPEKTAFYRVERSEAGRATGWMNDLADAIAGRNGSYYANTGWHMNSPSAVRRVEEVFAMLGLHRCLTTCIGIPVERFAEPRSYREEPAA